MGCDTVISETVRRFGGVILLSYYGWKKKPSKKLAEAGGKHSLTEIHGFTIQKATFLILTNMRTSNPTYI
jgi:hypothetical protein